MISNQNISIDEWGPRDVNDWLLGLCDDTSWLNKDYVLNNGITGKNLLLISTEGLASLGATKVALQEHILEAVDRLGSYSTTITRETLQIAILRLACKSRSLQKQLVANRLRDADNGPQDENTKQLTLSRDCQDAKAVRQRVDLNTLASVSNISESAREIAEVISRPPFSKFDDYRSMKSLILALSIELTSTAQRDQFVVRPNDIIEKSSKALADYCDRVVHGTKDMLLIQPIQIKTVRLRMGDHERSLGFSIRTLPGYIHTVETMAPLSAAKKTNELSEGDEIIYLNQNIVGWSEVNVQRLLKRAAQSGSITLIVKKNLGYS